MKQSVLSGVLVVVIVLAAGAFLLLRWCSSHDKVSMPTATRIIDIGTAYENFLADGGDASAFQSSKELISLLEGNNPRAIRYLWVMKDSRDAHNQVIDSQGRPLQITRKEGQKIQIRAVGEDGRSDTDDDLVEVYPREKAGRR